MPVVRGRESASLWRGVGQAQNVSDDLAVVMTIGVWRGVCTLLGSMDEDASRQILGLGQLLMADTCWVQAKAGYEGTAPFDGWARRGLAWEKRA